MDFSKLDTQATSKILSLLAFYIQLRRNKTGATISVYGSGK